MQYRLTTYGNELRIVLSGEFAFDDAMESIRAVAARLQDASVNAVCADLTGLIGRFTVADRYEMAEVAAAAFPTTVRIGVVVREQYNDGVFESVAFTRGLDVFVTTDAAACAQWLQKAVKSKED